MTCRYESIHTLHSLRFWAIWTLLAWLTFVDGSLTAQPPNSLDGKAGPPAIQNHVFVNPSQTEKPSATPQAPGWRFEPPGTHLADGKESMELGNSDSTKISIKPVSLEYLKERLHTVTSQLDLIRIFADVEHSSHGQLTHRVARTPRAALTPRQEVELMRSGLKGKGAEREFLELMADDPRYEQVFKESPELRNDYDYPADEPEPDYEAFEAAMHHVDEMRECSANACKEPQPYFISMRDPRDMSRVFIPQCTVLHRCMNFTGCCGGNGGECVVKRETVIFKAFFVVSKSSIEGQVEFDPKMATMIALTNHTECECRQRHRPQLPKCTKKCPIPFRVMREGYNCTCDCHKRAYENHWQCEGVKEGVEKLYLDGLLCIKKGRCYPPQCMVGTFDVKKGYCPLSDKYSLPAYHFKNPQERYHYRNHLRYFNGGGSWPSNHRSRTSSMPQTRTPESSTDAGQKSRGDVKSHREQSSANHDNVEKSNVHHRGSSMKVLEQDDNSPKDKTASSMGQTTTMASGLRHVSVAPTTTTTGEGIMTSHRSSAWSLTNESSTSVNVSSTDERNVSSDTFSPRPQELRKGHHFHQRSETIKSKSNNSDRVVVNDSTHEPNLHTVRQPRLGLEDNASSIFPPSEKSQSLIKAANPTSTTNVSSPSSVTPTSSSTLQNVNVATLQSNRTIIPPNNILRSSTPTPHHKRTSTRKRIRTAILQRTSSLKPPTTSTTFSQRTRTVASHQRPRTSTRQRKPQRRNALMPQRRGTSRPRQTDNSSASVRQKSNSRSRHTRLSTPRRRSSATQQSTSSATPQSISSSQPQLSTSSVSLSNSPPTQESVTLSVSQSSGQLMTSATTRLQSENGDKPKTSSLKPWAEYYMDSSQEWDAGSSEESSWLEGSGDNYDIEY